MRLCAGIHVLLLKSRRAVLPRLQSLSPCLPPPSCRSALRKEDVPQIATMVFQEGELMASYMGGSSPILAYIESGGWVGWLGGLSWGCTPVARKAA